MVDCLLECDLPRPNHDELFPDDDGDDKELLLVCSDLDLPREEEEEASSESEE